MNLFPFQHHYIPEGAVIITPFRENFFMFFMGQRNIILKRAGKSFTCKELLCADFNFDHDRVIVGRGRSMNGIRQSKKRYI